MFKKICLFTTAVFTAISASTGYGSTDFFKGNTDAALFLDWFHHAEQQLHIKGLIALDLIPALLLIMQAIIFFKDKMKSKGWLTVAALLANLIGVFLLVKFAYPIASQMTGWTPDSLPADWISRRDSWLNYIGLYGLTGVLGWLCMVITFFVSNGKQQEASRLPRWLNFAKHALAFIMTFILGMGAARLYEFCLFPYIYEISGATFIEMHRPVDLMMRKIGPMMFTIVAALHILLIALFFIEKSKRKAWLIAAALLFLLIDTFIALTYNRPINDLFHTWTATTLPDNWAIIRDEWLQYHLYRNICITLGIFAILLIYFVNDTKRTTEAI